jgi:invasion protein IalB
MIKFMVISVAAVALAVPASAQTAPAASGAPAASADKAKDPNRIICERQEEIGSRLGGSKVCHTAAEWDQLRRANREQVEDWQRQLTNPGKPGT